MKPIIKYSFALALCSLFSCGEKKEECAFIPNTNSITVELDYESLSERIGKISSKEELVTFLTEHATLRDFFFKRTTYPNDSVFINELYRRFTNPHFDTLLRETKKVFGSETELKSEFEQAFKNIKYYYPNFRIPRIETAVSGFDTDLYVSDSLLIIGLDYYLGPDAKYRPDMYAYLLQQYRKENIVPSFLLIYGIEPSVNRINNENNTVLADMIAYGKSYYFAKQMMPCTADSIFIWYTDEEMSGAHKNQDAIWYRLIENEVLYSTSHLQKQKFLMDRPRTVEVGDKCPGRIAQWVGWQIVKAYMERNENVTLNELMQNENADEIFKDSKYKPVRK
jgi:hypothetical protein